MDILISSRSAAVSRGGCSTFAIVVLLIASPLQAQEPKPVMDSIRVRQGELIAQPIGKGPAIKISDPNRALVRLPISRTLLRVLANPLSETYRVYRFDGSGGELAVERKDWVGTLGLPDPSTGELQEVEFINDSGERLRDTSGRIIRDWFYSLPDRSYAKQLLNERGEPAGLFTIAPNGSRVVAFDLDGDARVDLMTVLARNGMEYLLLDDDNGILAANEWMRTGVHPLCVDSPERGFGPPRGRADTDSRATLSPCPTTDEAPGTGGAPTSFADYMDETCEGILSNPPPRGPGGGIVADDASTTRISHYTVTALAGAACGLGCAAFAYVVTENLLYPSSTGTTSAGRPEVESDDPSGSTSEPVPGEEGQSFEKHMYEVCKARAEADWRYPDSMEDLERSFVKQRCPDPKVQPASVMGATVEGELSTWCERDDEREQPDASNLNEIFGGGNGSSCGPVEQPGPDGKCSGIGVRASTGAGPSAGIFEMGLGVIVPLGCAGRPNCDPSLD
ncbi:MAG: hypothetical protein ACRELU_10775 [Gemmatimonadota bacterium]